MVNLYEELGSYRAVAALVGCDHKTVKATLERGSQPKTPYPRRSQLADPYLEMITSKVDATEGRIHGKAMLRVLRAAGYRGSSRTLFRVLKVAKLSSGALAGMTCGPSWPLGRRHLRRPAGTQRLSASWVCPKCPSATSPTTGGRRERC